MEPSGLESTVSRSSDASDAAPLADRLQQLLLQLWMTSKSTIAERLDTISRAQILLEKNALDEPARLAAQNAAHKLAGILGTFGLPVGSELARQVEVLMEQASKPGLVHAGLLPPILEQLNEMINQKSAEIPSA